AQWLGALSDIGGPARLVDRCVKWSYGVNDKPLLPSTIQRACQLALRSPKGPVFVSIPMEYLFDKMTKNASAANVPAPAPRPERQLTSWPLYSPARKTRLSSPRKRAAAL